MGAAGRPVLEGAEPPCVTLAACAWTAPVVWALSLWCCKRGAVAWPLKLAPLLPPSPPCCPHTPLPPPCSRPAAGHYAGLGVRGMGLHDLC